MPPFHINTNGPELVVGVDGGNHDTIWIFPDGAAERAHLGGWLGHIAAGGIPGVENKVGRASRALVQVQGLGLPVGGNHKL
ncbi:MAG: hypothetical protein DRQ62_15835 [Gammaproteobacteria bacterium]|nr:MAG: hypothetical protein DRQ62_15835 [Gammaproteobacteria bacterium]